MCNHRSLAHALERKVPCWRRPEAIPGCTDPLDALCLQRRHDRVHVRHPRLGAVASHPSRAIEALVHGVRRARVALEEIRHNCAEAVTREVINQKLSSYRGLSEPVNAFGI